MKAVFAGWTSAINLLTIVQTIVDGLVVEVTTSVTFKGIIQPLNAQQLMLKPEGERSWQWLQIHAVEGSLNLKTNDKIQYNGFKYKVMGIWDYSLNGFIEYHIIQDYE